MAEDKIITFKKLSNAPGYNVNGGATRIGVFQWDGTKFVLTNAEASDLRDVTSRFDKLYSPDETVQAEAVDNGLIIGESQYNGILEINENITTGLDSSVDIEFGTSGIESYFAIDLTVSVSNLNVYKFIGYVRSTDSLITTSELKCTYSGENAGYESYKINVSDFIYDGGKPKLRVSSLGLATKFTINAKIQHVTSLTSNGLKNITISAPYLHGLTLSSNKSDIQYDDVMVETTSAGVITRTTGDVSINHINLSGSYTYTVNNATSLGYAQATINKSGGATISAIISGNTIIVETEDTNTDMEHTLSFKILA